MLFSPPSRSADLPLSSCAMSTFSRSDRRVDRFGADILYCLLLGTGDLFLSELHATPQGLSECLARLLRVKLRLPPRHRDNILSLFFGVSTACAGNRQGSTGLPHEDDVPRLAQRESCRLDHPVLSRLFQVFCSTREAPKKGRRTREPKVQGSSKHITPSSLSKRFFDALVVFLRDRPVCLSKRATRASAVSVAISSMWLKCRIL